MKRFAFILVVNFLLADGRKLSNQANDKDNLPLDLSEAGQTCDSHKDCGEFRCCFWTQCYPKPTLGEPCSPEKSSCPCMPGLVCTKHKEYNGQKFYRCLKPDIDITA